MTAPTFLASLLAANIRDRRKLLEGDAQAMGEAAALGHYFSDIAALLAELPETDLVSDALAETAHLLAEAS